MNRVGAAILLFLTLCVSGVTSQEVVYNFNKITNFAKFETYKWVSVNTPSNQDVNMPVMQFAFDEELVTKGLVKTDSDQADLYVVYQTAVGQASRWVAYGPGWPVGPQWGGTSMTVPDKLRAGDVELDIYDASKKMLVWRGVASKAIDLKISEDKRQKNLQKAIKKLLSNYPPK